MLVQNPRLVLAQALMERARRARQNRLKYYKPYAKQREFHAAGKGFRERLFSAGNQLGKALLNGTLVLTPHGWVPIEELRVGDQVVAGDGSITVVTGVYPQGVKPLYRLTFDYGEEINCCGEHLWLYQHPAARYPTRHSHGRVEDNPRFGQWTVGNTSEILEIDGGDPRPRRRVLTPVVGAVQFDAVQVPLDPYLVGVLIGDGCLQGGGVSYSKPDDDLRDMVARALPPGCHLSSKDINHSIVGERGQRPDGMPGSINPTLDALRDLGLYGLRSHERFIPGIYMHNGPAERLSILQGLFDTDGSAGKNGVIEYSTTSERLCHDVLFLLRSLGVKARATRRVTRYVYKGERRAGRPSWRVYVRTPEFPLFRMTRKQQRVTPASNTPHHVLRSIRPVGDGECTCISVAHPSRTYVAEHFIVTHNTWAGSFETAMHLTGRYPDWWEGKTFDRPTAGWAASVSWTSTRDGIQRLLFGRPGIDSDLGTAAIPKDAIKDLAPQAGTSNAYSQAVIRHGGGGDVQAGESVLGFRAYEQGRTKFQVETLDFVWLDEEPPHDIYMEALTRTNTTLGSVYLTFTPLMGMSETVMRFLITKHPGTTVVFMGVYDAEHYTKEQADLVVGQYPDHEREARAFGKPVLGSGAVYPIKESDITIPGFSIPDSWPRIAAMDLGWEHPTAVVWLAHNRDTDIVYVYDVYKRNKQVPAVHASAIKSRGAWIPMAWPSDALQTQKDSGKPMRDEYRREGVNMLEERAQFDDGSVGVEPGLQIILARMQTGRLKVFEGLEDWFSEYRVYHRKDGVVVKKLDDAMDATRYGVMSLRYAQVPVVGEFKPYRENWRG